jgi:hypothetical protein
MIAERAGVDPETTKLIEQLGGQTRTVARVLGVRNDAIRLKSIAQYRELLIERHPARGPVDVAEKGKSKRARRRHGDVAYRVQRPLRTSRTLA